MPQDTTKIKFDGAPAVSIRGSEGVGSGIGEKWVQYFERGNSNITKEGTKGKYLLGALKSEFKPSHDLGVKEIETGVKGKVIGVVPVSEKMSVVMQLIFFTHAAFQMSIGTRIPLVPTYTDPAVSTTIKTGTTPTNDTIELTSATGLKVGDTIEIICGSTDFGTKPEYVKIETLDGAIATLNPPVSQPPEALSTVKKVKGVNQKAGGPKLPKVISLQYVDQESTTEEVSVYTFPKFQVDGASFPSSPNGGKDETQIEVRGIFIPIRVTYTNDSGQTESGFMFYEKDTYFKE